MCFEIPDHLFANAFLLCVGDICPQAQIVRELQTFFSFSEGRVEEIRGSLVNQPVH